MVRLMLLLLVVAPMIIISCAGPAQKGYILKVSKDIYQRVKVDAKKKSETFNLQQASSGKDVGDNIFDFKRNLTMIRLPEVKSCFLRDSIGDVPRPADLLNLIQLASSSAEVKATTTSVEKLRVVGKLNDRSFLSSEMAELCANLPIYRVNEGDLDQNDTDQMDDPVPAKRGVLTSVAIAVGKEIVCNNVCAGRKNCIRVPSGVSCSWSGCRTRYRTQCVNLCKPVCKSIPVG